MQKIACQQTATVTLQHCSGDRLLTLPLRLPRLLLKAVVYGLSYRRLHEVDVVDDLRREFVTQLTVKRTTVQTLCNITVIIHNYNTCTLIMPHPMLGGSHSAMQRSARMSVCPQVNSGAF